ncbi:hypothetical protein [Phormidesmis priestleyi]
MKLSFYIFCNAAQPPIFRHPFLKVRSEDELIDRNGTIWILKPDETIN